MWHGQYNWGTLKEMRVRQVEYSECIHGAQLWIKSELTSEYQNLAFLSRATHFLLSEALFHDTAPPTHGLTLL